METTNQNNLDKIISQDTEKINNDEQTKSEIVYIEVDKLHPHDANPRKNIGDVTELADSIKKNGILQNLTVVPATGYWYGEYTVIIGHRRLVAAKQAGLKTVPCVIREMGPKEQIATMLLENMQRSDLTVYEQAQGIQMMLDLGETVETVAEKTGFSESTVRRRTRLLKLDSDVFKETEGRQITMSEYDKLFEIKDDKKRNEVLKTIGTNNFENNLLRAVNAEKEIEKRKQLFEKLNKIAEKITDTDGLVYVSWCANVENINDFSIPDDTKLYYKCYGSGVGVSLYRSRTAEEEQTRQQIQKEQVEQAERENKIKEERDNRIQRLKEATERAYNLRRNFVKDFKLNEKATSKNLENFLITALLEDNCFDVEKFLNMLDVEYDEDDISDTRDVQRIYNLSSKTQQNKMVIAGYVLYGDNTVTNCFDYKGCYCGNEELQRLYDGLTTIGYEMSDEEKALMDGTHELYTAEDE